MPSSAQFAEALARAARTISHERTLQETLDAIARTARTSVPGIDHAGLSLMHRDGSIETMAATDDLVRRLDSLQYELSEGPCVSAMRETPVVTVPMARHDQRWPLYMPKAVALGLRAQLAVRIFLDDRGTMGGLNLYSTTSDDLDEDAENIADLFAAHAAIVLDKAREVDQLNEALESRKVIGMALGILMERYQLDEQRAFAFLVRASAHDNVKLRDVAATLVEHAPRRADDEPDLRPLPDD